MNKENCIKALEYTEERYRETSILDSAGLNISEMCSDILNVLKNCIEIPDGATNGDMIKTMFPNARVIDIVQTIAISDEICYVLIEKVAGISIEMRVLKSWWNAPFKIEKVEERQELVYADQDTMEPAT